MIRNSAIILLVMVLLAMAGCELSLHAQPTNNVRPGNSALTVDTNGLLLAPTNFFKANSNLLNQSVAAGGYTLPTASTTVLGGIKVDGTTITVNGSGVASVIGGGGSGSVTNITGPTGITWSNPTSNPSGTWNTQSSNTFFAGPISGSAASPGFRFLTNADFNPGLAPIFNGANLTSLTGANVTGTVPLATSATSFSGSLSGNVTGTQSATVLSSIPAISGALLTALTGANVTGTVPAATTSVSFTGSLVGDVTGTQGATVVSHIGAVDGGSLTNVTASWLNGTGPGPTTNSGALVVVHTAAGNVLTNGPVLSAGQTYVYDATQTNTGGLAATNFPAGGSGSVTSVDLAVPAGFSTSGGPVTTTGVLTLGLTVETANTIWAGPASGSLAQPGFRFLTNADFPSSLAPVFSAANLTAFPLFTNTANVLTNDPRGFTNTGPVALQTISVNNLTATNEITNSSLTASTALASDANKGIVSSSTTATELGYVHNVTSAIQTQLNALFPAAGTNAFVNTNDARGFTNSGPAALQTLSVNNFTATNEMTNASLTASTALASDANKGIVSSTTTATELGYVHNVTSAIQTQLNALFPSSGTNAFVNTNDARGFTNTGNTAHSTLTAMAGTFTNSVIDLGPATNTLVAFGNAGVLTNLPAGTNGNYAIYDSSKLGSVKFVADVNLTPAFIGSSLTALNASQITSGTLPLARFGNVTSNTFLAGPDNTTAANPTFRALDNDDIQSLTVPAANLSGTVATARLGSGSATSSTMLIGNQTWATFTSGTVTSVTFTGDGVVDSATPSTAVTSSGTVAATIINQTSNTFLAGPTSGGAAAPTFRALNNNDFNPTLAPTFSATNLTGLSTNGATIIQTNLISGLLYTNNYGYAITVSANVAYTVAAVNGNASIALQIPGSITNTVGASSAVGVTIAMTYSNMISGVISNGGTFALTNLSAGAGDTATYTGAQISYVQQLAVATSFAGNGSGLTNLNAANIATGTLSTNRYTRTGVLRTLFIGAGAMNPLPTNSVVQTLPTAATNSANTNINRDAWTMSVTKTNGVHFAWFAPPAWNQGTIAFRVMVTDTGTNAGTATNYVWSVAAQDVSQAGSLANALGTAIQTTSGLYTNTSQLAMATSAAVTVGGSPVAGDMIDCQIKTLGGNGSFTVTNTSFQVLGVILQYSESTNEPTTL